MIKVRLMGDYAEIAKLRQQLEKSGKVIILDASEIFPTKASNGIIYYRQYLRILPIEKNKNNRSDNSCIQK